jgi:glycosyltransferase involved in cell wall biosynthesis
MKVLHLVKYYSPSKGGIETAVGNIVNGVSSIYDDIFFTIYTNSHLKSDKDQLTNKDNFSIITKATRFFLKNQPMKFYFKELRNLIFENDIIHLHYPYPNIELAMIFTLSSLDNKRLIITWHANIEKSRWSFISPIYNYFIRFLLQKSSKIIITSPSLLNNSRLLLKFKEKVTVIPLSISSAFDKIKPYDRKPIKPFKLLYVGKLRKYKGVDVLIRAIKNLDVKLTIVGDGAEFKNLSNLVKFLNINDKIVFKSGLNDSQVMEEYKNTDLFVLPSVNEAEAFGIVQLEAMSFGLPVINTKLNSGVPYVSLDNQTGYTVLPNNVLELENAIIKIFSSPKTYKKFSINSKLRSLEFSNEKMAKSYLSLYV